MDLPVVFLAFGARLSPGLSELKRLSEEAGGVSAALKSADESGLCEVVVCEDAGIDEVFDVFQDSTYAGRIAIFHYGGHADGLTLLFENASGKPEVAHGKGLAAFLAEQPGLQLVFLNGCATQAQVDDLLSAGVPAVIATSTRISDSLASDFAKRFYTGLAGGASILSAFRSAQADVFTKQGAIPSDAWRLFPDELCEDIASWNLRDASRDYLFGLELPADIDLPDSPYRYLEWYGREHARVFFGRSREIRELYELVTEGDDQIILLHGQSGVGKSSLLAAGLLPYLEDEFTVVYARRDPQFGLLRTLISRLSTIAGDNSSGLDPATQVADPLGGSLQLWRLAEEKTGKPLLVILDQVEEAVTRSTSQQAASPDKLPESHASTPSITDEQHADELRSFLHAFRNALDTFLHNTEGRLILSFRKEWFSEVKAVLESNEIDLGFKDMFLQRLDQRGIEEIVDGPTLRERMRAKYHLITEPGLATTIAHDLIRDWESPVAPTLQILLSEMWRDASNRSDTEWPQFTQELYRKHKGSLSEFLERQLRELRDHMPEAVDTGLALDVLAYHTSPDGLAEERNRADIFETYSHQQAVIPDLLRRLQNLYLLVEPAHNQDGQLASTRLAHDTLAPLVRKLADISDLPGQRALRNLVNRAVDWRDGRSGEPLDDIDLKIVEDGQSGMRQWTRDEIRLVDASRQHAVKKQRSARNRRRMLYTLGGAILVAIAIAVWFSVLSQSNAQRAQQELQAKETQAALRGIAEANAADAAKARATAEVAAASEERLRYSLQLANTTQLVIDSDVDPSGSLALLMARDAATVLSDYYDEIPTSVDEVLRNAINAAPSWRMSFPEVKHFGAVLSIAYSSDGRSVASASADQSVIVWDSTDGRPIGRLIGHQGPITSVVYSKDGKYILTSSTDKTARLWDSTTMRQKFIFRGHFLGLTSAQFSPDGTQVLTSSEDGSARIWDLATGQLVTKLLRHAGTVNIALFSPDGGLVSTIGQDGYVRIWRVASGAIFTEANLHFGELTSATYSHDGKFLYVGSANQKVAILDFELHKISSFVVDRPVEAVALTKTEKQLLVFTREVNLGLREACIWDIVSQAKLYCLGNSNAFASAGAFRPNDDIVVIGDLSGGIIQFNLHEKPDFAPKSFSPELSSISRTVLSPDKSKLLVVIGDSGWIWDVVKGVQLAQLDDPISIFPAPVFDKDSRIVAALSASNRVTIWDAESGETLETLSLAQGNHRVFALTDTTFYVISQAQLGDSKSFSLTSVPRMASKSGVESETTAILGNYEKAEFSRNGDFIIAYGYSQPIGLWHLSQHQLGKIHLSDIITDAQNAVFTDSTDMLALVRRVETRDDSVISLFDIESGRRIQTLTRPLESVTDLEFGDGDKLLIVLSQNGEILGWRHDTDAIWQLKTSCTSTVSKIALSNDGNYLLCTGSETSDGGLQIEVWNIRQQRIVQTIRTYYSNLLAVDFSLFSDTIWTATSEQIQWWDTRPRQKKQVFADRSDVAQVAYSRQKPVNAIATTGGEIELWNTLSDTLVSREQSSLKNITILELNGSATLLLVGGRDGIEVWSVGDTSLFLLNTLNNFGPIAHAYFVPGSDWILIVNSSSRIIITSTDGKTTSADFDSGVFGEVYSVALSPNGTTLFVSGKNYQACFVDLKQKKITHCLEGRSTIRLNNARDSGKDSIYLSAFTPNGELLATSASGEPIVRIWDAANGQLKHRIAGHVAAITSLIFDPFGSRLISTSLDGTLRIWRTGDLMQERQIEVANNVVRELTYAADRKTLLVIFSDGNVMWLPGFDELLSLATSLIQRPVPIYTKDEVDRFDLEEIDLFRSGR